MKKETQQIILSFCFIAICFINMFSIKNFFYDFVYAFNSTIALGISLFLVFIIVWRKVK